MVVLLSTSHLILGLGPGLFAIVVVIVVGLVASMLAWTANKGMTVLLAFMVITLVLILVFVLSPKDSGMPTQNIEYDHTVIVRGSIGGVLGLGVLLSLFGLLVSHVLVPIYAIPPQVQ
eukprot:Phypoly_transcript_20358.p1 GENE.Phypoly_transcript_20358~~Phypoly_transcript_20358.p1  ORF type:complete len:118 (+),score=9.07 Phypoly_transcript_20358:127-480(+)